MPIYEYECAKCGHPFEVLIRSDKDLPKRCPACGASKPRKAFSAFAVASGVGKISDACESCPSLGKGPCSAGSPCASGCCPF
jgi:putative FmdB family regulatory protein